MWLRRVGLPPLWPSRLKVSLMCVLQASFIYSFTTYLNSADVDYLDLSLPKEEQLLCAAVQPMCTEAANPLACLLENNELLFGAVQLAEALPSACASRSTETCSSFTLSVRSIHRDLGRLHTTNRWLNPLRLWAFMFAMLTGAFVFVVLLHDHALIMPQCRPSIKSLRSLQRERPVWWGCAACVQFTGTMHWLRGRCRPLWIALLPIWWVWRVGIFVGLVYPITMMASWSRPVGMSRIMVFCTGLLVMILSLGFTISISFLEGDMYGLFWNAPALGQGCVCLCEYPLNGSVVGRLVFLGLVVFVGAFSVSFRALKGLRRANWGNLFSVLYAVPVEVFPVRWERPKEAGGGPITFRKEGEEVQGEPAFDPFCLMDEQPESGESCARLRPEPQGASQRKRWERAVREADIGCCGFPMPVQSKIGDDSELDEVAVVPEDEEVRAAEQAQGPGAPQAPVVGILLHGSTVDTAFGEDNRPEADSPDPESRREEPPLPPLLPQATKEKSMLSM